MIDIEMIIFDDVTKPKKFGVSLPPEPTRENIASVVNFFATIIAHSIPTETPKQNVTRDIPANEGTSP